RNHHEALTYLHLAALASLKGEILDLSSRLHTVTQERDLLEKTLSKTQLEKLRLVAETEERAELQAQRYEERLTELHSVIAELSRKIERQRALVIREEDDISENEDPEVSRCEAEGSTANLADDSELQDGDRTLGDADSSSADCCENQRQQADEVESPTEEVIPRNNEQQPLNKETATSCHSLQMAALAEELAQMRAENAALQEQLARQEEELSRARGALGGLRGDRDRLRKKIREVEGKLQQDQPRCSSPIPPPLPVPPPSNMAVVPQDDMPVCKIAERVVLRKMENNRQITGSQLATYGVCNTVLAESLVSELQEADLQELSRSEAVRRQYEVETERLTSRLEHARAQNAVLALTLDESKTQCDRLSLLVGKYESNATALRLALSYSDRAIEAYDVLVALLESELGLLLANCRAAGENRRAAETVARHLLSRLDNATTTGGMGPWDDYSHTTSDCCNEWGQGEERRLRDHIGKLKTERSSVRATVVELESCHAEPLVSRQPISLAEARKLDLETAVLMQELMAMREDKAELRARVYLLEKERSALELKLSSQEAHQAAQQATVQHLQAQLQDAELRINLRKTKDQELGGEGESEESELAEALRREARLKDRLQELVTTLEKVGKNSELRHQQSADLVNDLKRAN
ncbi:hypothetical protein L9F63_005470, partial [Diploptera punctata]